MAKVSAKHTSLGSGGDIATVTVKNTGTGTITNIGINCTTYSWHSYNSGGTVNSGPGSLTPGQTASYTCQAGGSGSYSGQFYFSGTNVNTTTITF